MAETTSDTSSDTDAADVKGQAGAPDHDPLDTEAMARLPNIFPGLRYHDAPAMIEWLQGAFGFEPHAVYPDGEGGIAHAQLRLGAGLVMLGSVRDDDLDVTSPRDETRPTGTIYIALAPDAVEAHYRHAVEAGVEITRDLAETDYGSWEYGARDPEGQVWSFGSYQPLAGDLVSDEE